MWLARIALSLASASAVLAADPVALLIDSVENGKGEVRFDERHGGYLPWVLEALNILPESQMLVFSKTSVQGMRIEPSRPRAIYFNDSVIAASVPGGSLELLAQDPQGQLRFYQIDQSTFSYRLFLDRGKTGLPIGRREDCASCHLSKSSGQLETLIRSVTTDATGVPLTGFPARNTDSRTPFEQLWGGWFVTGTTEAKHSGNTVQNGGKAVRVEAKSTSDIVALMVFEHQMRVMNLIARAARGGDADELAEALLFEGEAPLPSKVAGTSGYAASFTALGPLRQFDLNTRLMRYRCSYMVFSEAFDGLPVAVRGAVYRKMWDLLSRRDSGERRAILEILRKTKKDLPGYYH